MVSIKLDSIDSMESSGTKKRLIVVLGMHRSGTSVLSRALQVLGVSLGDNLLPPGDDNRKGFWEDADVNSLNIEMLKAINSDWDALRGVSSNDVEYLIANGFLGLASNLIDKKLQNTDVYGVKDPRMAKLFPFWQRVFKQAEFDVSYVVAVRNPLSVSKSLNARNQMDIGKGYLLWLEHIVESLLGTRNENKVLVDYDYLLKNPDSQLQKIAQKLGLEIDQAELNSFKNEFLDKGLRHSEFQIRDLQKDEYCLPIVDDVYGVLEKVAKDDQNSDLRELERRLAEPEQEWKRWYSLVARFEETYGQGYAELSSEKRELEKQIGELRSKMQTLQFGLAASERQRELTYQSFSWRITGPVRIASNSLKTLYRQIPMPGRVRKIVRETVLKLIRPKAMIASGKFVPREVFLSLQQDKPDYIVWGVIDWHFRMQRPQQLALSLLEEGRRVFYISSQIVHSDQAGFEIEPLDSSGKLFQIKLFADGAPVIYDGAPCEKSIGHLRQSIGELLEWGNIGKTVSLIDHPYWYDIATSLPNNRLVFDCMDHHEGFGNNSDTLVAIEKQLIREAELTITTSAWLDDKVASTAKRTELIRNAGDYEYFSQEPDEKYQDPKGRKVIGYYGAIAEWFDFDLVASVAKANPECSVLLIGADTAGISQKIGRIPNITFIGEVPYQKLPFYLYGIDVCLLPFKVIPLTLATNPVKAYEYLSAKKPVVTVDLPEMQQFEGLMYIAEDHESFVEHVAEALAESDTALAVKRSTFAKLQTWRQRANGLINAIEQHSSDPRVSVVVVTYNNLELTKACLNSLEELSQYDNLEIIVVDNNSQDESPAYLSNWVSQDKVNRKLILNEDNRGFAAANNQGLELAGGEYLALLNNDTHVTPGWVRSMVGHLRRDSTIGLIGPVTNNIGNEAKISISYDNMDEMLTESASYTRRHIGKVYPLRTAAFFCVMLHRTVYEKVGSLDEAFGRGFFEDDDYCRRIEELGLKVVCAEDVFIHHQLSASFDKLKQQDRQKLFEENKKIYEAKWGEWVPHSYR